MDLPDPSININETEEFTRSPTKGFWSGEKEVKGFAGINGTPTVIVDIGHLPYPQVLTVDVLSDIKQAGQHPPFVAVGGQRASVFIMEIGIGRVTWLQKMGARTADSPDPGFFYSDPTPAIRAMRTTILAQSLRVTALRVPGFIEIPGAPKFIDRVHVSTGAWVAEATEERPSFDSPLTTIAQSAVGVELLPHEPWGREDRRGVIIYNDSVDPLLIGYNFIPGLALFNFPIIPGERWEMPRPIVQHRIGGIWTAAGAGAARITVQRDGGVRSTF
jgi:hypothetical protein